MFLAQGGVALLREDGRTYTYGDLLGSVKWLEQNTTPPGLAVALVERSLDEVATYVAVLESQLAVFPVATSIEPAGLVELIAKWAPEYILLPTRCEGRLRLYLSDYTAKSTSDQLNVILLARRSPPDAVVHPELKLLLRTSGSTGPAKIVRLSRRNVVSNAENIAAVMHLERADRGVTALPIDYSFGLSVLHSHLWSRSSLWVTALSPETSRFWSGAGRLGITVVCCVPSTCRRLQMASAHLRKATSLRLFCQAAGPLSDEAKLALVAVLDGMGAGFAAMYGQTEATARMSFLEPASARDRLGSVGRALPGGEFAIEPTDAGVGQITYRGPNVMMGYASARLDLAKGDELFGSLNTGDVGYLKDGYLYLTGRADRMVKLAGRRHQLEDIEADLYALEGVAVIGHADGICVFARESQAVLRTCRRDLALQLGISVDAISLVTVNDLPRTATGKTDYATLARWLQPLESGAHR